MVLEVLSYEKISYPMVWSCYPLVLEVLSYGFGGVILRKHKLSYGFRGVIL